MIRKTVVLMVVTIAVMSCSAATRPVLDHVGYAWTPETMDCLVRYLQDRPDAVRGQPGLVAGISPHDDYLYAGPSCLPLFEGLQADEVIIFGVTHRTVREQLGDPTGKLILDTHAAWTGPYGNVPVSNLRSRILQSLPDDMVLVSDVAHRAEHSIEGMVPFLQYFNRDVRITPIMVTRMSLDRIQTIADRVADVIANYCNERDLRLGRDVVLLMSADANHYGEDFDNVRFGSGRTGHDIATRYDQHVANDCLAGLLTEDSIRRFVEATAPEKVLWCGHDSIPMGLWVLNQLGNGRVKGQVLHCSDSFSAGPIGLRNTDLGLTAPFSLEHWVSHVSVGYRLNKKTIRP